MVQEKNIFKSKTFWLSMATLALGVVEGIKGQLDSGATLSILGVLQLILRVVTKEAVKWKFWE